MRKSISSIKIPHVFIFLSSIILFSAVLTYFVPSGNFVRESKNIGGVEQSVVVPGSYQSVPKHFSIKSLILGEEVKGKASPTSLLGLFTSIPKGMNQSASLIFFVFIIGAVFNLIQHTGTVNVVMYYLMQKFRQRPIVLFFVIFTVIFTAASFLGMGTEFIPMIPLFLIIAKETGYNRLFGLALFLIPMNVGWTAALTNPFNLQIAQKIAELPIGSGMGLRLVFYFVALAVSFLFLMRYGKRVKLKKEAANLKNNDADLDTVPALQKEELKKKHIYIILTAVTLFGLILYAVQTMGWGLIEMTGGFFMVGLSTIVISGMSGKESMKAFIQGLETMLVPALIVGFARGIQVVMFEGQIVDTMLNATAQSLQEMHTIFAVEGMFAFQSVMNFFIPSASGQALVSMPLMVPLSDLLNISRQTSVLAYVMGDGFSNIIIPTSGELMAILGIASVPFEKWFKFIWPLFLTLVLIGMIFLAVAVLIGY